MIKIKNLLLINLISISLAACSVGNHTIKNGADASTFAGNINVSANGQAGHLSTTNGNIVIEQQANAKSVKVTNGNITVEKLGKALSLQTTNGNIHLSNKVNVSGDVTTTNGNIEIANRVTINGSIQTTTGDIKIGQSSIINGDIIFQAPSFLASKLTSDIPALVMTDNVTLAGKLHLYQPVNLELATHIPTEKVVHHYVK